MGVGVGVGGCRKTHSVEISLPLFFLLQHFPQNTHLLTRNVSSHMSLDNKTDIFHVSSVLKKST